MKTIPTAREFLKQHVYITKDADEGEDGDVHDTLSSVAEAMKAFADLHRKAALQAAADNSDADVTWLRDDLMELVPGEEYEVFVINSSILDSYPEENIK